MEAKAVSSESDGASRGPAGLIAVAVLAIVVGVGALFLLREATNRAESQGDALPKTWTVPSRPPGTSEAPGTTTARELATPVVATGDTAFDQSMTEIARFVEHARGHPFKGPVEVQFADGAEFEQRALAGFEQQVPDIRKAEVALKALGVIPLDSDLVTMSRTSDRTQIAGFFDPETKALVIRGKTLTPLTRTVIAHELTHALDDQWYSLDALSESSDEDRRFAFRALVEGSSSRVEDQWTESRTAEERAAAETEAGRIYDVPELSSLPPEVRQVVVSPYSSGKDFVSAVVKRDGIDGLDRAFASPPVSSEQILHVQRYRDRDEPAVVAAPPADEAVAGDGVLGEVGLLQAMSVGVAPAQARAAAEGWVGDHYVVWTDPADRRCIRDDIRMETDSEAEELVVVLREWTAHHIDATVEELAGPSVRFTSCS